MTQRTLSGALAALAFLLLALATPGNGQGADAPVKAEFVRIGMVKTLFIDVPQPIVDILAIPFAKLMKDYTGMEGKMVAAGDPFDVAMKLSDRQIDLAVLHGVEFGWVQKKHPELRPLMVCVNRHRHVKAFLVVRHDSEAKDFADLKGKEIFLPKRSKEHCRLFAERGCCDCVMGGPKIVPASGVFDALDDLLRGKTHGVITDTLAMEDYDSIKPGCFARLKVIQQSERFPAACIAYRHGALDEATLKRFRDGMIDANKDPKGREVMSLFKMSAFEPVPVDYTEMLNNITKIYPDPVIVNKLSQQ